MAENETSRPFLPLSPTLFSTILYFSRCKKLVLTLSTEDMLHWGMGLFCVEGPKGPSDKANIIFCQIFKIGQKKSLDLNRGFFIGGGTTILSSGPGL
jgi:hypothetical protein